LRYFAPISIDAADLLMLQELILRVERIENGELTENKEAPVEV